MKGRSVSWLGLVVLLAVPLYAADFPPTAVSAATTGQVAKAPSALTPPVLSPSAAQVVKLSSAGFSDELILAYVKKSQTPFNLSPDEILRLKEAGVSSPVILAMLTRDSWLRNQNPPAPYTNSQKAQLVAPGLAPADQTPPAAPEEVIPVAPGPDYYWAPGYWGWNGGWIWIGGSWCFRGGYYGWGGHYSRGWYGHGGWGYHGSGGYHGGWSGRRGGNGFHGGGGHGGGGHGGGHGR